MFSKSAITTLLILCASTTSISASTIRFWNHTRHYYTASLSLIIETFDATDIIDLNPGEYKDRTYDKESIRFSRLIVEDDEGRRRLFHRPFSTSHYDNCTIHIYESSVKIE